MEIVGRATTRQLLCQLNNVANCNHFPGWQACSHPLHKQGPQNSCPAGRISMLSPILLVSLTKRWPTQLSLSVLGSS